MDGFKMPNLFGGVMERLKLGSVIDSLIAFSVVLGILLVVVAIFGKDQYEWLVIALFVLLGIFVITGVAVYLYWTFKDPNKLRTEEHEQTMFRMNAGLGEKGHEISAETLVALPNTTTIEPKKITKREEK